MKLIPNWRRAWRMFSVQAMTAATAILGAWQAFPPDLRDSLPETWVHGSAMALLVLGIVGRLIAQPATKVE